MTLLYFSESNKLKNAQKQLERFQITIIDQLSRIENPESQQLCQYFESCRLACDDTQLKLDLQYILDKLKYVRRAVTIESGDNIPDLKTFQEDLINVINRIQDLKVCSQVKVEELSAQQNQLTEDIKLYTERLPVWTDSNKLDSYKNDMHSKVNTNNTNIPNDVKKFMVFVKKSNGHENGWTPSDHHLFLKLRKKFPDVVALSLNLHEILPDISLEEVKQHEIWYVKYLNLKEKNNEAIKRWQKLKKDVETIDVDFIGQSDHSKEEGEEPIKFIKTFENRSNEQNKSREDIENWKKEREIMKNQQRTMKEEEIKQTKMKDKEREHRNKIKKEMVRKWKEEKYACKEEEIKCEKAKKNIEQNVRISVANEMIKHYQIRDKVRYNKNIGHSEKNDILQRKGRSTFKVSRDPARLFRPTQQWIHRFLDNENVSSKPINFIGRITKLHKPCWRQNL